MKIIDKYIFMELIIPLFFGVAAFTGIFVGTGLLFELIDIYNSYGVRIITLVQLFFLELPAIMVITFPMATLLGTIMAFGRLSGDSEITALRAGGVSVYRLVVPALIIGLLMTFVTIGVNEYIVPEANFLNKQIVNQFKNAERKPRTRENLLLPSTDSKNRPDFFLYAARFNGDTGEMTDVIFQDYEDGRPVRLIEARQAIWTDNGNWEFKDGTITYLKPGEKVPSISFGEFMVELMSSPEQISLVDKDIEDMRLGELQKRIDLMQRQGKAANRELIQFYQRFSIPFANFIFVLVAASLGIHPRRSGGSATGMGISIGVIFIYYTIMTVGSALGEQGTIHPFLGAWVQNFVFMIVGGFMLYRVGG